MGKGIGTATGGEGPYLSPAKVGDFFGLRVQELAERAVFLKAEGAYEETSALAIKRVLAWQLEDAMEKESLTKNEMAKRMHTSRSQLDRILDPTYDKIQLDTVFKAARALGREVKLELG